MYHDIIQREQVEGIEIGLSDYELPKQVQGKLKHLTERLKQSEHTFLDLGIVFDFLLSWEVALK